MKRTFTALFLVLQSYSLLVALTPLPAESAAKTLPPSLELQTDDVVVEHAPEGGFFLWVRYRQPIQSILLTDRSQSNAAGAAVYSLRDSKYNPYHSEEKRMLNGELIKKTLHSLIDSTPESSTHFAEGALRIHLPASVIYGYPWSRQGSLQITAGSQVNIRTFTAPYGDDRAGYRDNSITLTAPASAPTACDPAPLPPSRKPVLPLPEGLLTSLVEPLVDNALDVAVIIGTNDKTAQDREKIIQQLSQSLRDVAQPFDTLRVAIVEYRGPDAIPITRTHPFTSDLNQVEQILAGMGLESSSKGNGAMYEGIYTALNDLEWQASRRLLTYLSFDMARSDTTRPEGEGLISQTELYRQASEMGVRITRVEIK